MSVVKTKDLIEFLRKNEGGTVEKLPVLYDMVDNLVEENENLSQDVAKYKQLYEQTLADKNKIATFITDVWVPGINKACTLVEACSQTRERFIDNIIDDDSDTSDN